MTDQKQSHFQVTRLEDVIVHGAGIYRTLVNMGACIANGFFAGKTEKAELMLVRYSETFERADAAVGEQAENAGELLKIALREVSEIGDAIAKGEIIRLEDQTWTH